MSLNDVQIAEIVRFDYRCRVGGEYDKRRYGSVTGSAYWGQGSRRENPIRKTLRYNYIALEPTGEGTLSDALAADPPPPVPLKERDIVVLHVAVRLNKAYHPVVKVVAKWHIGTGEGELRDIDYRMVAGWVVSWTRSDYAGSQTGPASSAIVGTYIDERWYKSARWTFGGAMTFPWHDTINPSALIGTKYEYCQYKPGTAGLVDWLMLYKQEPKVELLARAGLRCMVTPSGLKAMRDPACVEWVRRHAAELRGKKVPVRDVLYAYRHRVTIAAAARRYRLVREASREIRVFLPRRSLGRLDYDRIIASVGKWGVSFREYAVYLQNALHAEFDMKNDGTLYPPVTGGRAAFMARNERYEAISARIERERVKAERAADRAAARAARKKVLAEEQWIREIMSTRFAELDAFQRSFMRSTRLRGSGYTLVVAKTQKELRAEGRRMSNCVGDGTYGRAILRGDTLIVMLQRGGKSYCDIEVDRRSWRVRQCYIAHNQPAPAEVEALARQIASVARSEYRRHRKQKQFKGLLRRVSA